LESRVEVGRAEAHAVIRKALVKATVGADGLLCAQRRVAKAHESQT
jgi:hypothetical protein